MGEQMLGRAFVADSEVVKKRKHGFVWECTLYK